MNELFDHRWDRHFLKRCLLAAEMSKDPSTVVGAVIVGSGRNVLGDGFNGFPRGVKDTPERLNDREMKLKLIVHAERNALLNALLAGTRVAGGAIYVAARDAKTGEIWGGCPCTHCLIELIQAGIKHVVTYPMTNVPNRWKADLLFSKTILFEAGLTYREVMP